MRPARMNGFIHSDGEYLGYAEGREGFPSLVWRFSAPSTLSMREIYNSASNSTKIR
jgi:hypothetical protein